MHKTSWLRIRTPMPDIYTSTSMGLYYDRFLLLVHTSQNDTLLCISKLEHTMSYHSLSQAHMSIVTVVAERLSSTVSPVPFRNGAELRGSPQPTQAPITIWLGGQPRHRQLHKMFFNQANWCINMFTSSYLYVPKTRINKKDRRDNNLFTSRYCSSIR